MLWRLELGSVLGLGLGLGIGLGTIAIVHTAAVHALG